MNVKTGQLSWGLRRRLYQQAASQIKNGVSLPAVLKDFSERLKRRQRIKASKIVDEIHRQVRDGSTLTAAMGESLSYLERDVLGAGEKGKGGRLPEAMKLVLEVQAMIGNMRLKLFMSFFAPIVFMIVLYATLAIIGGFVVPRLLDVLPLPRWTGWAYVMYLMGQAAVGWEAPLLFGGLVAYVVSSVRSLPRWTGVGKISGRAYFDRNAFPFTVYREVAGFTWLMSYLALIRAGIPETVALEAQIATASPWLASRLSPIYDGMKYGGLNLVQAMRRTGYEFPSLDLIDEVGAYVGFDDFTEKLEAVLRDYAKTLEMKLLFKGAVISGVFSALIFVAFLVVAVGGNSVSEILASSMGT
jgi:type II secretory pathway component PulF